MKKLIASLILVTGLFVTNQLQAQCNLPSYAWQQNKNRFVIQEPAFTSAVYSFEWKEQTSNIWQVKEIKLHHVSSIRCQGNNATTCTYTVGVVQVNTPCGSYLFCGVQDGWVVRFAKKCSDGTWSNYTPEYTVNF